ncbi:MAG: DNA polymerase III subunit gamma/tau [Deltaproteobacteria bacterium]|nr:DNA polymerase III subunit gamma/tau [Deltaproteobacteria bacterium]
MEKTYLPTALRWRPKNFFEVAGQEHVIKVLCSDIANNRIKRAYLFLGAYGVGKTTVARILAKRLNCLEPRGVEPCNKCNPCLGISSDTYEDYHEIDGGSATGVDNIRWLRSRAVEQPLSPTGALVFVIDEAHMLTNNAFNALLKILEEPPCNTYFILVTTAPHKIPATVRSRCQAHHFRKISFTNILKYLKSIITAENINMEDGSLSLIARESDGSLRDAENFLDKVCSYSGTKEISIADVISVLGTADRTLVIDLASTVVRKDSTACLHILRVADERGVDIYRLYHELIFCFRDLMVMRICGPDKLLIKVSGDEMRRLFSLASCTNVYDLQKAFSLLAESEPVENRASRPYLEYALIRAATR